MRGATWPAWALPLALYVAAALPRLALAGTRPYGDEAHHYYIARHLGATPDNVFAIADTAWLFWWRPLFSLLLSPGAQAGFTGFRIGYVLLVATLAPALWWWLRARGVSPRASAAAGLLVAFHPFLVVWGVRAFPDELMAAVFVAGLALWERGRVAAGAATLLAAAWVKEVAIVGVGVLLAEEAVALLRRRRTLASRDGARALALVGVLALAYLPHLYAERIGGRAPGWSRGHDILAVLDGGFTSLWFVPFVVAALALRSARRPALLALAYLAFFTGYGLVLGGRAEQWYFVLPTVLAIAAIVAALDAVRVASGPVLRRAARPAAALALAVLCAQILVPSTVEAKQAVLHPGVEGFEPSYAEAVRMEAERDQDLWTALDHMEGEDWDNVLLVDVAWFFAIWPVSEQAGLVATAYTQGSVPDQVWADAIERVANATLLRRGTTPLSLALGDVYGDCITDVSPEYVLLRGQGCPGRLPRLQAAYEARARSEPAPK